MTLTWIDSDGGRDHGTTGLRDHGTAERRRPITKSLALVAFSIAIPLKIYLRAGQFVSELGDFLRLNRVAGKPAVT